METRELQYQFSNIVQYEMTKTSQQSDERIGERRLETQESRKCTTIHEQPFKMNDSLIIKDCPLMDMTPTQSDNEQQVEQDDERPNFMIITNDMTQDNSRNQSNLNQIKVRSRNRNALDIPDKGPPSPLLP